MKKIILTVAAVFAMSFANAQDLKSKKGENYLPQSGDWAISFNADGIFEFVGNAFNGDTNNNAPSVDYVRNNSFVGKKFTSDKNAYRVVANLGFGSSTDNNPQGSQGYFIYSIKPKSNLDTGELIENVANIFFDFNPPITTNTTKNRFVRKSKNDFDWTSGVKDNNSSEKLFIYPNPVQISLNFNTSDKKEFRIRNSLGVLVLEGECEEKIDLAILSKGIYIIEIQTKNQSSHFKFLKE